MARVRIEYPEKLTRKNPQVANVDPIVELIIPSLDDNVQPIVHSLKIGRKPGLSDEEFFEYARRKILGNIIDIDSGTGAIKERWKNRDLSNLNFSEADNLDDIDISGSLCIDTKFGSRSISGMRAINCTFERADFDGVIAVRQANFSGSSFKYGSFSLSRLIAPNFRGAELKKVQMRSVGWREGNFARAKVEFCDFSAEDGGKRSTITDFDWGNAQVVRNDLSGVDMSDSLADDMDKLIAMNDQKVAKKSLPDRGRHAIFMGNKIDKETLASAKVASKLRTDKRLNFFLSKTSSVALTSALFVVDYTLDLGLINGLSEGATFGKLGLIYVGIEMLKSTALDPLTKKIKAKLQDQLVNLGKANKTGEVFLCKLRDLAKQVVIVGHKAGMTPIIRALEAIKGKSLSSKLDKARSVTSYATHRDLAIIICDKRHLADALGHISSNRARKYKIPETITLVRADPETSCAGIPSVVSFDADGPTTLSWVVEGETMYSITFDEDGNEMHSVDMTTGTVYQAGEGPFPVIENLFNTIDLFESQILRDNDLGDFSYDREEGYVVAGQDGTIYVRRKDDSELHNKRGPALVQISEYNGMPSWHKRLHFLEGKNVSEEEHRALTEIATPVQDSLPITGITEKVLATTSLLGDIAMGRGTGLFSPADYLKHLTRPAEVSFGERPRRSREAVEKEEETTFKPNF